jgi:hypothetical protein
MVSIKLLTKHTCEEFAEKRSLTLLLFKEIREKFYAACLFFCVCTKSGYCNSKTKIRNIHAERLCVVDLCRMVFGTYRLRHFVVGCAWKCPSELILKGSIQTLMLPACLFSSNSAETEYRNPKARAACSYDE